MDDQNDAPTPTTGVGFAVVDGYGDPWGSDAQAIGWPGTGGVPTVRFPRATVAVGTLLVTGAILVGPWVVPLENESGVADSSVRLLAMGILIALFGWFLALLMVTAVRGGSLSLTPAGVLVRTGVRSVLIPWTAIIGVSIGSDGSRAGNPLLRLSLRADHDIHGWPWPTALDPVFLGSSRRQVRMLAWWFRPVSADRMVATVRHFVRHPEQRSRIGTTKPRS